MATRTAIAAADRKVKQDELQEKKRQNKRMYNLEKEMLPYKQLESASQTTKNISQAAYGKGGVAGGMSGGTPSGISDYSNGYTRGNDPSWYKKFGLAEYGAKVPTFYRLGMELRDEWLRHGYNDAVPGIAVFMYLPTLPNQLKTNTYSKAYQQSPINVALTRFMAELRKLNSRIGDYDPADIGLYWYANIGILTLILNIAKALRAYNTYYAENAYLARSFIKSCGFDPADFIANAPLYKASLIKWTKLFNANAVLPNTLDFIKRYIWLATAVVKEHKGRNCQLYHFECPFTLTLDLDEDHVNVSHISADWKYATISTQIDAKIQNLYNSVGIVTMTADLRAAFSDRELIFLSEYTGSEELIFSESMHDLEQIHNCRTIPLSNLKADYGDVVPTIYAGASTFITGMSIGYDSEGYLFQGTISGGNMTPVRLNCVISDYPNMSRMSTFAGKDNNFLNFYDSEYISDDAVLEATRLRVIMYGGSPDWNGFAFAVNGTEVITDIMLITNHIDSEGCYISQVWTEYDDETSIQLSTTSLEGLSLLSSFDWFPVVQFVSEDDDQFKYTFGEIDHAVALSNDNLRIIHEGCAYSLFYIDSFKSNRVVR